MALPPPAQHAAIELLRGTMDRHSLVAYRDDRERDPQPIAFPTHCPRCHTELVREEVADLGRAGKPLPPPARCVRRFLPEIKPRIFPDEPLMGIGGAN